MPSASIARAEAGLNPRRGGLAHHENRALFKFSNPETLEYQGLFFDIFVDLPKQVSTYLSGEIVQKVPT